jgi:hypothetical protein
MAAVAAATAALAATAAGSELMLELMEESAVTRRRAESVRTWLQ